MRNHRMIRLASFVLLVCGSAPILAAPAQDDPAQDDPVQADPGEQDETGSASARWGANYFPNVPLVTHEGRSVRFFDDLIKDKVVAINFIYTSCPDSCPLETARLMEVKEILGDRMGKDVFFLSISIDPERDTPEVLNEYARMYQAGPGWEFLTGDEADITLLRKKLGLYIDEIQEEGSNDHNLSLIIGNQATGRWVKRSPFENPYVLASQIGGWLHNWAPAREEKFDYEDAPELRTITKGESLFRTRCAACHIIGEWDGMVRAGPNLLGVVERRDREWLGRWLAAPDQMLKDKDPIAWGLFMAFNRVPMPNLRLTEYEVNTLIDYLETESHRVEATLQLGPEPADDAPKACCLKRENLVLSSEESEPPAERRRGSWPFSTASIISIGLGCALGLVSAVLKFRAR